MIAHSPYQTQQVQVKISPISASNGLSRIFAAAVVSRQFCRQLLQDPTHALQNGYLGETFNITDEERDLIISIRAETLSDLASQINQSLELHVHK
jgi:hypothetical protein